MCNYHLPNASVHGAFMAPFESYMNGYENYETSAHLWEWQLKRAVPGLSPRVVGHELRTP